MAAAGIVIGLVSGLLVVVYRLGIEYGTDASRWIYARIRETPWLIAPWAVAAVAAALAIAWMVGKEPMAGGSGIPQTNGVVICGLKMRWQTILPVRFVGGLLGALFGLSLGRVEAKQRAVHQRTNQTGHQSQRNQPHILSQRQLTDITEIQNRTQTETVF